MSRMWRAGKLRTLLREARISCGMCSECGARPSADDGGQRCDRCRERHREKEATSQQHRRAQAREMGACVDCGRPAVPGQLRCPQHRDAIRQKLDAKYARKRLIGECLYCADPALPQRRLCERHTLSERERGRRNWIGK